MTKEQEDALLSEPQPAQSYALLSCPFCGSDAEVHEMHSFEGGRVTQFCIGCQAYGPSALTTDEARGRWNTRSGSSVGRGNDELPTPLGKQNPSLAPCPIMDEGEETTELGKPEPLSETDPKRPMEASVSSTKWQPIESAPVNSSVLVFIPNAEHYGPGIYRALRPNFGVLRSWQVTGLNFGRDCEPNHQPTHWMPLPEIPQI